MEDLLIAILQGLFEFALEVLAYVPIDWPLSARKASEPRFLSAGSIAFDDKSGDFI